MEKEVRYIQLPPLPEDIEMPALEAIWLIARMNPEQRKDALEQIEAMMGDEENIKDRIMKKFRKYWRSMEGWKTRVYLCSILNAFEVS